MPLKGPSRPQSPEPTSISEKRKKEQSSRPKLRAETQPKALFTRVNPWLPEALRKIVKCRHELAPPVLLRKLDDVADCFSRISLRLDLSDLDSSKRDC